MPTQRIRPKPGPITSVSCLGSTPSGNPRAAFRSAPSAHALSWDRGRQPNRIRRLQRIGVHRNRRHSPPTENYLPRHARGERGDGADSPDADRLIRAGAPPGRQRRPALRDSSRRGRPARRSRLRWASLGPADLKRPARARPRPDHSEPHPQGACETGRKAPALDCPRLGVLPHRLRCARPEAGPDDPATSQPTRSEWHRSIFWIASPNTLILHRIPCMQWRDRRS